MDEMSIEVFPEFARQHWERIRSALQKGTYHPAAVLRVMIPKASGGQRPLGIPTVLDRVIQQAIAQVRGSRDHPVGLLTTVERECWNRSTALRL
jgi:RNA-directed DNA polymerase